MFKINKLENDVSIITKLIHKKDLGKKTSELENAIRVVLKELKINNKYIYGR